MRKLNRNLGKNHVIIAEATKEEVRAMVKKNKLGMAIIKKYLKKGKEISIIQLKKNLKEKLGSKEINKAIESLIWNGDIFKPRGGYVKRV